MTTTADRLTASRLTRQQALQVTRAHQAPTRVRPRRQVRDGFEQNRPAQVGQEQARQPQNTGNPRLDSIANATLVPGRAHTCTTTVRNNLRRLGLGGLPASTGNDSNNPRGMMSQMLQSGQWRSAAIPGSEARTIDSPYGAVQANVMTGEQYRAAVANGTIPNGSVVFQTRHGWDYSKGSRGNDVGILQNGRIFNYAQMPNPTVYANTREVVVLQPRE